MMKMMIVATRTSEAEKRLEALKAAGLSPLVLDVDSLAIVNAFEVAGISGVDPGGTALIHFGGRQTHLSVVQGGRPAFTRDIEVGGETLIAALAHGLGLNLTEGETLKASGDATIRPHLEPALSSLAGQLRSSLDDYQWVSGERLDKVYIGGGTSLFKPLPQFLSDSLDISAEKWDPFQSIYSSDFIGDSTLRHISPVVAVDVGLANRRSTLS
jgi:type IV pilus assembly protein PilM